MFIKSNGAAVVWSIAALVLVVFVSGLLALLFPADIHGSTRTSPPQVGRSYSKEEIEQKELRAQEELTKAREEFRSSGFSGVIGSEWLIKLPYVALAALAAILLVGRRAGTASMLIMSLPLLVLMLIARVDLFIISVGAAALASYIKLRHRGKG